MAFSIKYKPLLHVNILHQYYLNKGITEYADMTENEKAKQLNRYNFSKFFSLKATTETKGILNGYQMVLKTTHTGLTLFIKVSETDDSLPIILPEDTLTLSFLLNLNTYTFFSISNFQFEKEGELFFFSNQRLSLEAADFPLLKKTGANTRITNRYALNDETTQNELKKLSVEEKANLFGIIRLHMKGNTQGLDITDNQNKIKSPCPTFELNFENRKTTWRYIFETNQNVKGTDGVKKEAGNAKHLITRDKLPLTASGFISVKLGEKELPNPSTTNLKPSTINNKIFSDIYM
jgi:hypothetical protein